MSCCMIEGFGPTESIYLHFKVVLLRYRNCSNTTAMSDTVLIFKSYSLRITYSCIVELRVKT